MVRRRAPRRARRDADSGRSEVRAQSAHRSAPVPRRRSSPLHNNISELNLRRQVLGRRNWLFVGSDDGAAVNTVFVSLLASARLHGIEPHGYLRDFFSLIRPWPADRLLDLAPAYWQKTLEQPETQQKLAANIFRRAVLSSP